MEEMSDASKRVKAGDEEFRMTNKEELMDAQARCDAAFILIPNSLFVILFMLLRWDPLIQLLFYGHLTNTADHTGPP